MTSPAPTVTAAEADLLEVARALVGLCAWEAVEPLIGRGEPAHLGPAKLGAPAGRLLEATLARGVVQALARRGGARPLQFLGARGVPSAAGRLWQRHPAPVFRFTGASLALLRWLLGGNLRSVDVAPLHARPETLADQLLVVFALDGLATLDGALGPAHLSGALAAQEEVRGLPLAWLTTCPLLAAAGAAPPAAPAWASLFADEQATLALEALAPDLARRWLVAARRKREISDPALAVRIGTAESAVLAAFMDAAGRANRRDLALWIADAGGRLYARPLPADALVGGLDPQAPLSERVAARRAAGALAGALGQWARWDGEHRSIGFVDDGYAAAQFLLARYEALAGSAVPNARAAQAELERLSLGTAAPIAVERTLAP